MCPKYAEQILTGKRNTPQQAGQGSHSNFLSLKSKNNTYLGIVRKIYVTGLSSFLLGSMPKAWGKILPSPPSLDLCN